jgi:creatinine amidohydrolase
MMTATWRRYEELRPDQLAELMQVAPVAYWSLGLLEHHGWQLPVGFDGIKADRICARLAERTGGVVLPVMWWGGLGGHGDFMWTFYQSEDAARAIVLNTVERLITYGFRAIVLVMGHYPWEQIAGKQLDEIQRCHPDVLIVWGTEASIGRPDLLLPGDHAAREETSYGLALLPEFVDMTAMRPGHDMSAWPNGQAVPHSQQYPAVRYEPADPLFAQMGEDARIATAQRGEEAIALLVDCLARRVAAYLAG